MAILTHGRLVSDQQTSPAPREPADVWIRVRQYDRLVSDQQTSPAPREPADVWIKVRQYDRLVSDQQTSPAPREPADVWTTVRQFNSQIMYNAIYQDLVGKRNKKNGTEYIALHSYSLRIVCGKSC
ncbi:hypothetical protein RRG08_057066 [Elysia crispata]|uniref:Uncharacterized protein n=1 Tax=Elysia crispata TaxID=231223 RepID=A0AAE1ALJ2_9GAST|nr:hypothetical protein RRG08_057066 [Elysia crispata]